MVGDRDVLVIHDTRMLAHQPNAEEPFIPGKLDSRVQAMLSGLFEGAVKKWSYPEHPGRLSAITDLLMLEPVPGVGFGVARAATHEELGRVHTTSYLENIFALRGKQAWLDVDTTAVSPGSVDAAELAAGAAINAVEAVVQGRTGSAFALCRPPGHHAESVRARGFCLFNNVAVAAAHARAELGCERVLIVDWDVHHGNGTQEIFLASPDVLFFDTHRAAPFYPGSGNKEEIGQGLGEGTTINVPLPAGCGDPALIKAFREILVPAAEWFKPDLILVSAGFDLHRLDMCMNLSFDGFAAMTGIVQELADRLCNGRLVMVLEGGYNLEALARGVHTVLEVMAGGDYPEIVEPGVKEVAEIAAYHKDAFS
ncbi:histone deacetylase family protein [Hydrocarboniclastica marina]|uniref:Histone deacetylase n=1 Tax=Hydrocarboniclastica marina TaxID=2259620 RepID=A0A4P7XEU8_9ALTE|nr:histone deacetylase [Hydrocarboniclastica marina]MAL97023.1 histone deacetylase [Alteromonadaceae bacterium]QCF25441.1 histone deacetylase [Hydrocarboniclastica marina]|tara:strand:- start:3436 stop:4539 length:1104 start_codon:yes stop_codon:yes gene_type:complete